MLSFTLDVLVGIFVGGAIMFYIQPQVKTSVAKVFGTEAALAAKYRTLAADLKVTAPPTATPPK